MCERTICQDCGKYSWTGCGQHIAQVLAGLQLEQICSCDDDRDSEHSWASLKSNRTTDAMTATATNQRALPRYPLPFAPYSSSPPTATSDVSPPQADSAGHCPNPSPVEYKLSKISSASAEAAAVRMAQQAAALEELRRMKENKEKELKVANESALQRLLHGLSESTD